MTTSRGQAGRVSVTWPGLIPRCPAPVTELTRCTRLSLSCAGRLPVCSDPRLRPFQIVQTRATHSVRLSLGPTPGSRQECLGPNRPGCGADDGADGRQRPGCHDTGPGPYLTAAAHPWDWPVHVVYCTVYFVLSCHVAQHCPVSPVSTTRTGHSLPLPGSP